MDLERIAVDKRPHMIFVDTMGNPRIELIGPGIFFVPNAAFPRT